MTQHTSGAGAAMQPYRDAFEKSVLNQLDALGKSVEKNSDEINGVKLAFADRRSEVSSLRQIVDYLKSEQDSHQRTLAKHTTLLTETANQLAALSEITIGKSGKNGIRATVVSHDRKIWLALGALGVIGSLLAWLAPHIAIAASLK